MPALEMEMLCCSMASWMLVLSWSFFWGCAPIRTCMSRLSVPSCACVNVCERVGGAREEGGRGRERKELGRPNVSMHFFCRPTHLVKLINETHTLIGQHQCPCLQGPLLRDGTPLHVSRQTHSQRPLSRGEHRPRGYLLHILEELGLGCTWVPTEEHVDVPPHLVLATVVMATKRSHDPKLAHISMTTPTWGYR